MSEHEDEGARFGYDVKAIEIALKNRIHELESLAFIGDHHFPDLTYKELWKILDSRCRKLEYALEIIAGRRQPIDNLLSNIEIAVLALEGSLQCEP
jgi:hypothetical protein